MRELQQWVDGTVCEVQGARYMEIAIRCEMPDGSEVTFWFPKTTVPAELHQFGLPVRISVNESKTGLKFEKRELTKLWSAEHMDGLDEELKKWLQN